MGLNEVLFLVIIIIIGCITLLIVDIYRVRKARRKKEVEG